MKRFLMVLLVFGFAFAALSVPDWSLSESSYRPGSSGVLTLDVSNPCTVVNNLVSCSGVDAINSVKIDVFSSSQLTVSGQQFIGDIEPGGSTTISMPFKVSDNAKSSIYTIDLQLSGYSSKRGEAGGFEAFSRRLTVPVTVVNAPVLGLSTDKQLIGGIDDVVLKISNDGGKASRLRVTIPETSEIAIYGKDELFIQNVSGSASLNVTLDSRDADNGPVDVPFSMEYEDELGMKHTETKTLRMTVRNEKLDLRIAQMSNITTRNESVLMLKMTNNGDDTLKDVRLDFKDSTSIRLKDKSEFKFGDLEAGESSTESVVVFADLTPGVNLVDTQISWIEKDVQREEDRKVALTVTSDADIGIYLEGKPLPLTIGKDHTISVLVSNLGSYQIENVDVSIASPALRSIDISDVQYIGGLQTDDFSTVQFQMNVNATSTGTYPVDITVNYRDRSGEWIQKTIQQKVTVYNNTVQEESPLPLLIGLFVVAAVVWYFRFRKK